MNSSQQLLAASPREWGAVYTPPDIARQMVRACLVPLLRERSVNDAEPVTVLDPACGEGAFLAALLDAFCEWYLPQCSAEPCKYAAWLQAGAGALELTSAARSRIAQVHLFGVDIDPLAIRRLHGHLCGAIDGSSLEHAGADQRISPANVHCGDALLGDGWEKPSGSPRDSHAQAISSRPVAIEYPAEAEQATIVIGASVPMESQSPARPLHWREAFPAVAQRGGFDLIIGNPPYLREKNAKPLFDRIAATELGRWREPRMDLWYYFVHRSLDLLKPGGMLSFIVNSYWTASSGARKLIDRLQSETMLEEIRLLDAAPVFSGVSGRHMIFRLKRSRATATSRTVVISPLSAPEVWELPHTEVFQHGRLVLAPPDAAPSLFRNCRPLSDFYRTRQGMAENPPRINRRLNQEFGGIYRPGEGVFVLTAGEVELLGLSVEERQLLRPYYETASLGRYRLPTEPTHWVLYLCRKSAPSLANLPAIARHLGRFRPILDRRRETQLGLCAWWHLHWPRDERIFTQPRILSVQMGAVPQFTLAEQPTYAGFSVNMILPKDKGGLELSALTGILNSSLAAAWFERHAKHRGVKLDISAGVLKQFPLPPRHAELEQTLSAAVRERQSLSCEQATRQDDRKASRIAALETHLDQTVTCLYQSDGS